ncbi:MAG: glycosyltransferase family 39 protein [Drouetiella hepatica Uher 2000/2452]|uniref:Glycosyltransferase family 39 protein n=1 Tax=Drouetiella hepatica Uher 2000/2452 TaxID=904376 RepID=A0A951QFD9_9CYAN|nr:glycosyltransferase family 39 protein [Drouetiella hepatica Uher 2000/2452]
MTRFEKQPRFAWICSIAWVALVTFVAFWLHLGSIGLVDETEPLFAEAARQMNVTGDWVTPYFNGVTRFDKPALVYWIAAIAYKIFGVNEWSARFPSAIAATALTGLGFYTLRRFGYASPAALDSFPSQPAATQTSLQLWLSAAIGSALIALNPQTIVWGRTGVSDMLLNGCIGSALLAFFVAYAQPDRPKAQGRWYLAFYVLTALAVLTKGPVGAIIPGLIVLVFLLYVGKLRPVLREMRLLWGGLLFAAIALPWFVLVIQANGEAYINAFFGYHNFERFTQVVNRHSAPWYFYFLVVPIGFLPWSIHLPIAIARLQFWQRRYWQQQPRSAQLGLFAWVWFGVIFGFFTIAVTKLPSYTIPLLPAAAILTALFWSDQMTRSRPNRATAISHWANVGLLVSLAGAILYCTRWMGDDPEMPKLPELLEQSGILIVGAVIWGSAAIVALALQIRRQGRWLWGVNLVGFTAFVLLVLMPATAIMDSQRQLPLRQMAVAIVQAQQPAEPAVMVGFAKPSMVFYTQRPITYIEELDDVPRRLVKLAAQRPKPPSILVLGRTRKLKESGLLDADRYRYETIANFSVYQLLRINLPLKR